jgi:hypothetical protein
MRHTHTTTTKPGFSGYSMPAQLHIVNVYYDGSSLRPILQRERDKFLGLKTEPVAYYTQGNGIYLVPPPTKEADLIIEDLPFYRKP